MKRKADQWLHEDVEDVEAEEDQEGGPARDWGSNAMQDEKQETTSNEHAKLK